MTNSDWIQLSVGIVLLLTLLAVLWYAWETRKMAKATTEQARVTLATLKEVQKQRLDSFMPRLVPRFHNGESGRDGFFSAVEVQFRNSGNGPAVNTSFEVMHPEFTFSRGNPITPTLDRDEVYRARFSRVQSSSVSTSQNGPRSIMPAIVKSHYEDVEGNHWVSTLEVTADLTAGQAAVGVKCNEHPLKQSKEGSNP